jgi:hypothetical protein
MSVIDQTKYKYERIKHTGADGKARHTASNGDAVAVALRGLTRDQITDTARHNGVTEDKLDKWEKLNAGMFRMNAGLALRKLVKAGKHVKIGSHTVTEL